MSNQPFDIRSDFFREHFEKAYSYSDYLKTGSSSQIDRWKGYENSLHLTDAQKKTLSSFKRKMHVLVMSGIWCGDCMRQGPMLYRLAQASSQMDLRFIDNQQYPQLRDELRIAGGARVPVVVVLSEDYFEIGRFGDRTLSHYWGKAGREVGEACDSGLMNAAKDELHAELEEWLEFIERCQLILRLSPFLRARHQD